MTMALRMFDIKFPYGTQLTFGSLNFAAEKDGDLKMLPPEPAPEHLTLASSSASGGSCSGLDPCVGSYIRTAKIVRGIPVVASILRPLTEASSSSTSASTPDPDSSDDYPEIGASAYGEPVKDGRLFCMVALNGDRSNNTSNIYPTIGRSETSDARTPSGGLVQNLNPDFIVVQVQAMPFNLVYGADVVLPPEIYLQSARVAHFDPEHQAEARELDSILLEESCNTTLINVRKYQESLKKYYNKSVVQQELNIGDLVLKKDIHTWDKHTFSSP
jgi:hypothetical protein